MADYKGMFLHHLDEKGVTYDILGENRVQITFSGDNIPVAPIHVIFDPDGDCYVSLDCWNIANFPSEKMAAGLIVCNSLNMKWRWVKFFIDDEMDIRCQCDMIVEPGTVGKECLEYVQRMAGIIDEAYPELMKALWA